MAHYTAELIFKSYMPKTLVKGMLFLIQRNKEMVLYQMQHVPLDMDAYVQLNGYPVEPYIIERGNPNLNEGFILAQPHQIGWWDAGEHTDKLYDITDKEYNLILENGGYVDVEIEDELDEATERPIPILYEGKVCLSASVEEFLDEEYVEEYEGDEDEETDYIFDDDEEWNMGED